MLLRLLRRRGHGDETPRISHARCIMKLIAKPNITRPSCFDSSGDQISGDVAMRWFGKLNFRSCGIGISSHLCAVMFTRAISATATQTPFRASSDEMTAMIVGQIDLSIDSMTTIWPLAESGEVCALGVTTADRVA